MDGTIQVDLDGIWTIFKKYKSKDYDPVFDIAISRFLKIFREYKIKATFFVTGTDLLVKEKKKFVYDIVKNKHEIGNHSYSHNVDFMLLSREKKEREIVKTEKIIKDLFGFLPVGFRAPAYSVDEETINILEERGYLYDSSILPSFAGPLINLFDNLFSSNRFKTKFGRTRNFFAPLRPYHPSSKNIILKGDMDICEVPVTTCPIFRVPFHSSFLFAVNPLLFDFCYKLTKELRIPINYVLHGVDLIDPIDMKNKLKSKQPSLKIRYEQKEKTYKHILSTILKDYRLFTTKEYVKRSLK